MLSSSAVVKLPHGRYCEFTTGACVAKAVFATESSCCQHRRNLRPIGEFRGQVRTALKSAWRERVSLPGSRLSGVRQGSRGAQAGPGPTTARQPGPPGSWSAVSPEPPVGDPPLSVPGSVRWADSKSGQLSGPVTTWPLARVTLYATRPSCCGASGPRTTVTCSVSIRLLPSGIIVQLGVRCLTVEAPPQTLRTLPVLLDDASHLTVG